MSKAPSRGIEKVGKRYRTTVSVGGVPRRRGAFDTLAEAVAARDALDFEAAFIREHKKRGKKPADPSTAECTAEPSSALPLDERGVRSRLVRGEVRFAVRKWTCGKMRWGGVHATLEEAMRARDALAHAQFEDCPKRVHAGVDNLVEKYSYM